MKRLAKDSILSQKVVDYVKTVTRYAKQSSYADFDPTDLAIIIAGDLEEQGQIEESNTSIISAIKECIISESEGNQHVKKNKNPSR